LPEHHYVDEEGKFTKDVPGLTGDYVKAKRNRIAHFQTSRIARQPPSRRTLQARISSLLALRHARFVLRAHIVVHRHDKLRGELLKRNKKINWMPAHVKEAFRRMAARSEGLELVARALLGAPLPIWHCSACKHVEAWRA